MPPIAVFLQEACLQHRYTRTRDSSHIFERPERLRAVNIGLAAAIARLEDGAPSSTTVSPAVPIAEPVHTPLKKVEDEEDELTKALGKLQLSVPSHVGQLSHVPANIIHSSASVDVLNHSAVKYVHGDIEGDVYLETLKQWIQESQSKISNGGSEIPNGYNQGDLYRQSVQHSQSYLCSCAA